VFTGLVEGLGRLERVIDANAGRMLEIGAPDLAKNSPLLLGESISVNGCCLTAVAVHAERFAVQAGPETLARTNLGTTRAGDHVNLERALSVGDRLGGHFVTGHVDTTAALRERRRDGEWEFFAFGIAPDWTKLMVSKGSIAVDGVSLTLVDVWPDGFSVMLIPHTLAVTTLGIIQPGDRVNIEVDLLAKHIRKLLRAGGLDDDSQLGD
jgi:riboflavin synthase